MALRCDVLAVGTELLLGQIVDSNSAWIGGELAVHGIDSLAQVNDMQLEKKAMIESFAAGETQNVHELMIHIQKAGVAMSMTSAVRSKVMQAYQEVMRMQI